MNILAIDTSADETSAAVTNGRRVLSSVRFSQVKLHTQYGGIYPMMAKLEHKTKISPVVHLATKRSGIPAEKLDAIAVTFGPGLAPALEVGVLKAIELSREYNIPLIPVDHIEGHIYSAFVQNKNAKPAREFEFPLLALVVSGGHTQLVLWKNHIEYEIVGETMDDAAGEALDKTSRLLGLGYPGGPILERLAETGDVNKYELVTPMLNKTLIFSYSGLKTAFKRLVANMSEQEKLQNLPHLAARFQKSVFDSILYKLNLALSQHKVHAVVMGGGVSINKLLRTQVRALAKKHKLPAYFPPLQYLSTDNAAMIGVVAGYKYKKGIFLKPGEQLDRVPRAHLNKFV
jgi:N6-L-threonylcarbamoyladenine synthase